MPVNRNALLRYRTIDQCLQNRLRKWTLTDLIDACSDSLYEYEGIDEGVSKRTVQGDIQMMRSDKLGYNAPIIVVERKFYTYEEKDYSITNIPLSNQDLTQMSEAVAFLKQFKGFSHFQQLDGMVQKLEDHIHAKKTKQAPIIDFEKNENLKGLEYLDVLYQQIIQKKTINLEYQSFKARQSNTFIFHPYLLKEYRNRWFLLGCKENQTAIMTLALDRIITIEKSKKAFKQSDDFSFENYFKHVIGVTVKDTRPTNITFIVDHRNAPYVITKPFHHSQKTLKRHKKGVIFTIKVQVNFELERLILGYGESITILKPESLRKRIFANLQRAANSYDWEVDLDEES